MLVLHYTGMRTAQEALNRLRDPEAKVSAHYMVDENGTIYALVPEDRRAWHAGISSWRGNTNINQRSIGIEIVNPGHEFGYRPFPKAQMETVASLCKAILSRHPIPPRNIVAHSDIAPTRKEDPGELFDWKELAEQRIGLWPSSPSPLVGEGRGGGEPSTGELLNVLREPPLPNSPPPGGRELSLYGYDTADLPKAILAFQRHFFPERLTGIWDHECSLRLAALLAMV